MSDGQRRPGTIEVDSLRKEYPGGQVALRGISFSVAAGRVAGLIGPNGAGKTTTIGILTTRIKPTAGTASILGIDVRSRPAQVRGHIGIVTQENSLDRSLTGFEGLYFHGRFFGLTAKNARGRAERAVEEFDLSAFCTLPVSTLSGGQARRLMIARAMLHDPHVLFLDEPTVGLDPPSRQTVRETILKLRRQGKSIFLCTHDLPEASQLVDELLIIRGGSMVGSGPLAEMARLYGDGDVVVGRVSGEAELVVAHARQHGLDAWESGIDEVTIVPGDHDPFGLFARLCAETHVTAVNARLEAPGLDLLFRRLSRNTARSGR